MQNAAYVYLKSRYTKTAFLSCLDLDQLPCGTGNLAGVTAPNSPFEGGAGN